MILTDVFGALSALDHSIDNGNVNPLTVYAELKSLSDLLDSMMAKVKDQAVEERRKYGKEEIIRNGYLIEVANGRRMWKYDHSTRWVELNEKRKTYESLMQKAYHGANLADVDTGEIIEPATLTFAADTLRLTPVKS